MTAMIRKTLTEKPSEFDPRKYLGPARDELIKMIIHKNKEVLGSAGRRSGQKCRGQGYFHGQPWKGGRLEG